MRLTINSKKLGQLNFWMPESGGYIRLESDKRRGTLGQQICEGGLMQGNTLSATPESFIKVCHKWYNARMKKFSI